MEIDDGGISLVINDQPQEESIIKVIGVGGGGSNAVNHMYEQGIHGVEFVVCNTDIQALRQSRVKNRIQLGKELTEGLGAGSNRERGKGAALESIDYIDSILRNKTKMVFITAGMGGGTGTGAAPVIASRAKELGILTIAIVTLPFSFEGKRRIEPAMVGIDELEQQVDALLIINNDRLLEIYGNLKLSEAFAKANDVLAIAAKSIAEIITVRGKVNVDFADVKSVMENSGVALMGAAEAAGENRALEALENALVSPLLNSSDIRGASNVLLNMLYGDKEILGKERKLITDTLQQKVGRNVNLIWGIGRDETLGDKLRVSVIATGFNRNRNINPKNVQGASSRKVQFRVEEIPEDLEMQITDSGEEERKAREYRQRQEENKLRKARLPEKPRPAARPSVQGKNAVPDTDTWLKRKFGNIDSLFD